MIQILKSHWGRMESESVNQTVAMRWRNEMDKRTPLNTQSSISNTIRSETGYTLVETLVAMALILGVLMPAILFFGKISTNPFNQDLIIASQLARAKLEQVAALQEYRNSNEKLRYNNRTWQIKTEINNRFGLIEIHIKVFRPGRMKLLCELKTMRIED